MKKVENKATLSVTRALKTINNTMYEFGTNHHRFPNEDNISLCQEIIKALSEQGLLKEEAFEVLYEK